MQSEVKREPIEPSLRQGQQPSLEKERRFSQPQETSSRLSPAPLERPETQRRQTFSEGKYVSQEPLKTGPSVSPYVRSFIGAHDKPIEGRIERSTAAPPTVERIQKPTVVQEVIHPRERIEVNPIIDRQKEIVEVDQIIQPLREKVIMPTVYEERTLPKAGDKEFRESDERFRQEYQRSASAYAPTSVTEDIIRETVHREPIVREHVTRKVIEEIQPVLYKEVEMPKVIRTNVPIFERIVHAPVASHRILETKDLGVRQKEFTGEQPLFEVKESLNLRQPAEFERMEQRPIQGERWQTYQQPLRQEWQQPLEQRRFETSSYQQPLRQEWQQQPLEQQRFESSSYQQPLRQEWQQPLEQQRFESSSYQQPLRQESQLPRQEWQQPLEQRRFESSSYQQPLRQESQLPRQEWQQPLEQQQSLGQQQPLVQQSSLGQQQPLVQQSSLGQQPLQKEKPMEPLHGSDVGREELRPQEVTPTSNVPQEKLSSRFQETLHFSERPTTV